MLQENVFSTGLFSFSEIVPSFFHIRKKYLNRMKGYKFDFKFLLTCSNSLPAHPVQRVRWKRDLCGHWQVSLYRHLGNQEDLAAFTLPWVLQSPQAFGVGNTLATWWEELTHLKRPWRWERLKAGGEGDDRGGDGWMASPTQWTWVWVNSGSWWWTRKPDVLQSMGSQSIRHNWATELNWGLSGETSPWLCL